MSASLEVKNLFWKLELVNGGSSPSVDFEVLLAELKKSSLSNGFVDLVVGAGAVVDVLVGFRTSTSLNSSMLSSRYELFFLVSFCCLVFVFDLSCLGLSRLNAELDEMLEDEEDDKASSIWSPFLVLFTFTNGSKLFAFEVVLRLVMKPNLSALFFLNKQKLIESPNRFLFKINLRIRLIHSEMCLNLNYL